MEKMVKYASLTNHDALRSIQFLKVAKLLDKKGIVTEKVHGSNFSFLFNAESKTVRVASREQLLNQDGSGLFNSIMVFEKFKNQVLELGHFLNVNFQLFGELYGKGVQKEINYGCEQTFIAFDLLMNGSYVSQTQLEQLLNQFNIPVLKGLFECTFEELIARNVEISSIIACENGVNSIIEGFVWKPIEETYFQKTPDENVRVVIKYKSDKFKEKKMNHDTKDKKTYTSVLGDFENVIDSFINENRIDAVVSKIGNVTIKDFSKILPKLTADVIDDLKQNVEILNVKESKIYICKKCADLLRKYLQKLS